MDEIGFRSVSCFKLKLSVVTLVGGYFNTNVIFSSI